MSRLIRGATTCLQALVALCLAVLALALAYPIVYTNRVYPGVTVNVTAGTPNNVSLGEVALGGLTVEEATSLLTDSLPDPEAQWIELHAGDIAWQLSWADVGKGYNHLSTVAAAYRAGRDGPGMEQFLSPWRIRRGGWSVDPQIVPPNAGRVRAALEKLAPLVYTPPADAQLSISAEGVVTVPGRLGRTLDVETSSARLLEALETGASRLDLPVVDLPPRIAEAEPAASLAQSIIEESFILIVDDPLTYYEAEFAASREQMATWLEVVVAGDEMLLTVDDLAVREWLLGLTPQIGPERILDVDETLTRMLAALEAGQHQVGSVIHHPEGSYVVQPGDVLFDIAYSHGFPQWRLEEANPGLEPDALAVGMELTIPSIDVLFPEPLVPGKRIEIDLPEQRLRAYEDDTLAYDFTCSSGISSTPTIAGSFQVLFKEPQAYAQRWSLEMPYFMAVYQEGPEFANGIHELPISAGGHRLWAGYLGWPASYGCIILDIGDAEKLYNWAPVGTLVRIEGVAPGTPTYEERMAELGE